MKSDEIIFDISDTEKIAIEPDVPLEEIHCCFEAPIFLKMGNKNYLLANDSVRFNLEIFKGLLEAVLANKAIIAESLKFQEPIILDIGYIFNEYWQNRTSLVYEMDEEGLWIGYKYMLWGKEAVAWLYNKEAGDIVLEVTPHFPGKRAWKDEREPSSSEEISNSAKYEEWIKNYRPILIRTIPREVAQQWFDQANEILVIIEDNIKKLRAEGKF